MFTATICWRNISNHSGFTISSEWVFKNLGQFTSSEWGVLLVQIESPDTFLQSQERLINFSSIHSGLLILIYSISTSFTTCQINETHLSEYLPMMFQTKLENGMGSWGICICSCGSTSSTLKTRSYQFHDFFYLNYWFFCQSHYIDLLFSIFSAKDFLSIVE